MSLKGRTCHWRHSILSDIGASIMGRIARIIIPGIPHHVVQRGNRRQQTFFSKEDYGAYIHFMASTCKTFGVDVWAYCLMPNHVHLVLTPENAEGLRLAVGQAHQSYTRLINYKKGWTGHLWQGRFYSTPLDWEHGIATIRYVEQNPVRAKMVTTPFDYPWSSANAHLHRKNDELCQVDMLCEQIGSWTDFLDVTPSEHFISVIRKAVTTGRPIGSDNFLKTIRNASGVSP